MLILLYLSFVSITVLILFLLFTVRSKLLSCIVVPVTIFLSVSIYSSYQALLGTPTLLVPEGEVLVLSVLPLKDEDKIFLYILPKGASEPLSIEVPYNENRDQIGELQEALEGEEEGGSGTIVTATFQGGVFEFLEHEQDQFFQK